MIILPDERKEKYVAKTRIPEAVRKTRVMAVKCAQGKFICTIKGETFLGFVASETDI